MAKSAKNVSRSSQTETGSLREAGTARSGSGSSGFLTSLREWMDAIVIAYLLAMFIRLFVAELFKIPSSSMTPTLLGTATANICFYDVDGDGQEDMALLNERGLFDVYLKKNDRYQYAGKHDPGSARNLWLRKRQQREDRILVGKFFYWFSPPRRGDIVVFKVPENIFDPRKPIYIKRVVGLPGETLTFQRAPGLPGHSSMGRLVANGEVVNSPDFFATQLYETEMDRLGLDLRIQPAYARYTDRGMSLELAEVRVPENGLYVFGDNTISSQDSRYWGMVSLDRLRGRALFRYWKSPKFLR